MSTQLRGVLATQRVLEGIGVGRTGATATSAVLNFLVRDGSGMVANLAFTAAFASKFQTDIKRWRLFADIMVNLGITLEVAAVQFPSYCFLPMICLGNMCKAVCGVAAGACGGAIHLHWAQGSDIADVAAKSGAQHTETASLGLIFAAFFARSVSTVSLKGLWVLYSFLTVIHLYANTQCMRLMVFSHLNAVRLQMVLHDFWEKRGADQQNATGAADSALLTPKQVARKESLLFWPPPRCARQRSIVFGVSFADWVKRHGWYDDAMLKDKLSSQEPQPYWILADTHRFGKPQIAVFLKHGISQSDQAKAYFHADLLSRRLTGETVADLSQIETEVTTQVNLSWDLFVSESAKAGWNLSRTELASVGFELRVE